ncbi:hypothetical protein [Pedobacter panaciterrae]
MNENELVKKDLKRKKVVTAVHDEVKKLILEQYYEQKEGYKKKVIIEVAKDLGYKDLVLNLIGK